MMISKILRNLWLSFYNIFCKTKCTYNGSNRRTVKILANGPSLNVNSLISTDDVAVLNYFCFNDTFWKLRPQHYIIADSGFFSIDTYVENVNKFYKIINQIDWEIIFYVPLRYYTFFYEKVKLNNEIKIKTFYHIPCINENKIKGLNYFLFKKGLNSPCAQNVLIPSIFLMINEGYEKIYLYGADHSWISQLTVDSKNQVCLVDKHFYDKNEPQLKPWKKLDGVPYKLHELMKIFNVVFLTYHNLNNYAKYIGSVSIYNMTNNSYIDAFERK